MQAAQAKLIESLEHVEKFLVQHQGRLSGIMTSRAHERFSASRIRLTEFMTAQNEWSRHARSGTATKRLLRDRLVQEHMRPIAVFARAELPQSGELTAFSVPVSTRKFVEYVTAAQGMARAARVHEAAFLDAGFPENFIDQLVAAADALKAGIVDKGDHVALRVSATEALKAEARIARAGLRVLDARIRGIVKDPGLLGQWRSIRRIAIAATSPTSLGIDPQPGPVTPPTAPSGPITQPAPLTGA